MVEEGARRDQVVLDDVRERPLTTLPGHRVVPRPLARIEAGLLVSLQLLFLQRHGRRERGAGGFAEKIHAAVVVPVRERGRIVVEDGVRHHARLAGGGQALRDVRAERGEPLLDQRILVRVERVDERRHHEASALAAHLVHIEDCLRMLAVVELHVEARLRLRHHEPVAIVVMAGVRMIEEGQVRAGMLGAAPLLVPLGDHVDPVRIMARDNQRDRVLELGQRRLVFGDRQLVGQLHRH